MWEHSDKLLFPVSVRHTNPDLAHVILSSLGGDSGEYSTAVRYMARMHTLPHDNLRALYAHLAAEELSHAEIVSALVHDLIGDATHTEFADSGYARTFVENTLTPAYQNITSTVGQGDLLADISSDMAGEMRARVIYDNLLRLSDDKAVRDVLKFLRQREIVHYQRLGEALEIAKSMLSSDNYFAYNPTFEEKKRRL